MVGRKTLGVSNHRNISHKPQVLRGENCKDVKKLIKICFNLY